MTRREDGYLNEFESRDLWQLLAGKLLGEGCYRRTFELAHSPDLVIKVEKEDGCFHNVREWDTWQTVSNAPKWRRWLAPCVAISPNGRFLVMKRTKPVTLKELPAKVPAFMTDRKVGNFGRLDGKIVCHDYATPIVSLSLTLRKANWWEN